MATQTMKCQGSRARSPRHDCREKECSSGARNNYFLGKHLTAESYRAEQVYSIERRRLINRAVHGWGVVYGFALKIAETKKGSTLAPGELRIGQGLAFDMLGRELIQTDEAVLSIDNLLIIDENGKVVRMDGPLNDRFKDMKFGAEDCWLLSAHYAEKKIGPFTVTDPCRCERQEWNETCETVVYSLKKLKNCDECCEPWKCELHCCCPPAEGCCADHSPKHKELMDQREQLNRDYLERITDLDLRAPEVVAANREFHPQFDALAKEEHEHAPKHRSRGGCSCLCDHLTHLKIGADFARMSDADDCTCADIGNAVPLACLRLSEDKCKEWAISSIFDACGPRRLVKRNDLLFDLINGCDLTHIVETGWHCWHRRSTPPVPFNDFLEALGWTGEITDPEYPTRDFWVRFSRPVRVSTLTPDAFVMAVMGDHEDDYWRRYYRVPILAIETDQVPPEEGDPPGHVRSAKLVVWSEWLRNTFVDHDTIFWQGPTRVEIEVRGDLIVDCLGQQVDANSHGRWAQPSGNGSPGGTYISSFTVGMPEPPPPPPPPPSPPAQKQSSSPTRSARKTSRVH